MPDRKEISTPPLQDPLCPSNHVQSESRELLLEMGNGDGDGEYIVNSLELSKNNVLSFFEMTQRERLFRGFAYKLKCTWIAYNRAECTQKCIGIHFV